jgi:plastocyanin
MLPMMRRMTPHPCSSLALAWCSALALAAPLACAGTLQITVNNADGRPATDTVVLVQPTASWQARPLPPTAVVEQRETRFVPFVTVVPVGGAVRFVNLDSFDHHLRSQPGGPLGSVAPAKEFDFRLPPARKGNNTSADLRLDVAGTVLLGCHLHNSMRGHLFVSPTPWFAVTDAQGQVRIEGVPDGQAEVRLWHPDQLTDQAAQRVQVAGTLALEGKLNFSPRKRTPPPPPREAPRYE